MSSKLSFDEYQKLARRTALYPGADDDQLAAYPALGLAGEAGEVCEHVKKAIRDDSGEVTPERREALRKELGDVLWYVAALSSELGLEMGDIAAANIDKLTDRKERGVLHGEGDDR